MIILATMLVLFASVVLLIIIRRRGKYKISAMQTSEEAQRSNGELSMVSSLKEKPELSEGSVHTEASIEKQELNGSSTNVGTGQMNDYL